MAGGNGKQRKVSGGDAGGKAKSQPKVVDAGGKAKVKKPK